MSCLPVAITACIEATYEIKEGNKFYRTYCRLCTNLHKNCSRNGNLYREEDSLHQYLHADARKQSLCIPFLYGGKNYYKLHTQEVHDRMADVAIDKVLNWLHDCYHCQSLTALVTEFVNSCNICQGSRYLSKASLGLLTTWNGPTVPS